MIIKAILVSLVAAYGRLEQGWFGQQMIARPIWLSTLVGLVLGDVQQGVIIGGTLELIWAGVVQVGAMPTEVVTGSVVATSLAIYNNLTVAEAVAIAIPVGLLATLMNTLNSTICIALWSPLTNRAVEKGDTKAIWWLGIAGCATHATMFFIVAFLAFVAGSAAVQSVIDAIPDTLRIGLSNASRILPAIGIAVLLKFSYDQKYIGFLLLGFMLPTFLGFKSISVAIAGLAAALIFYYLSPNEQEVD